MPYLTVEEDKSRTQPRHDVWGLGEVMGMTAYHPRRTAQSQLGASWMPAWVGTVVLVLASAVAAQGTADESVRGNGYPHDTGQAATDGEDQSTDPSVNDDDSLADLSLEELMKVQVVVTASRREQKITAVPYAITVITSEDIRAAGARSVPDALRLAPGMDVSELSFSNAAVSPRGLHGFVARGVLVLVDGRQIFDSLFGGTLWGSWPFQLEDIERIEVIRGPGGVTWGANAVNGVINIVTKDPVDQTGVTLRLGGGSRGSFREYFGYGFQDDKLRMRVSGEYEASDGFRKGGSFLRGLDDSYKGGRISLHGIYDVGTDDRCTFSAGSALVDGGFPPMPLDGIGLHRNSGSQAAYLMGTWSHDIAAEEQVEVTAYINDFQLSPGVPAIDYRYQQLALQLRHTFAPAETHRVTWGIDSRIDLLDATNSDPFMLYKDFVSTAIIGLYLQDEWRFAPRWTLDLGGRIDYEFYGGFQPSARAALSYQLTDDSIVYGAVSRAFQMAPAGLRFLDIPLLNGLARVTGHRDIEAETLNAYEFGYRGRFFDRLETGLSLYWHEFDDIATLSPRLGPPGLMRMDVDSRASASMYGVELSSQYQATEKLTLLGHYTYQQLDWKGSAPFRESESMSPPPHKFMLGARYSPTDDLHLSSHLYFVDAVKAPNPANPFVERGVDSYFRLDLNAEYEFRDDQASIAVGVRNLLDSNHYEGGTTFLNDAEVPRMIFAELRLQIK
ncbi:MAG: TonB-dependent receptor [Planctomycetes bacterium]|nr:TonB-dependent receptor [Planctomycetota bacterium]